MGCIYLRVQAGNEFCTSGDPDFMNTKWPAAPHVLASAARSSTAHSNTAALPMQVRAVVPN
jgi:hypothetical protein